MEKNNGFLIDTHIFIWWMEKNKLLAKKKYQLLNNPQNQIFLSVASVWEIIIKKARQKLKISMDIQEGIKFSGFIPLSIKLSHIFELGELPSYHNDPFDRILIAQARIENLILITDDIKIEKYDLKIM